MKHSETYPFFKFKYPDGRKLERVQIPIRITNPHDGIHCDGWGLIDTGADGCVVPKITSDALSHNFNGDGVQGAITGGIGGEIETYKHTFIIELYDRAIKNIVWTSEEQLIDCVDDDVPVLIGVEDFLKDFELHIDYPKKLVTLSWD